MNEESNSGQCEDDQFKCGSQCIPNYQSSTFWACGDSCIRTSQQCEGRCHQDKSPCGDTDCKSPSYRDRYWECGEHCIEKGEPCDCSCPPQHFLCRDQCQPDTSTAWWMCGEVSQKRVFQQKRLRLKTLKSSKSKT